MRSKPAGRRKAGLNGGKAGEARDEIHAYIAIRDLLLSEAEKAATEESLHRVSIANESVETCLLPLRSPYEAQYLTEMDAARERLRCSEARRRIAELRRAVPTA